MSDDHDHAPPQGYHEAPAAVRRARFLRLQQAQQDAHRAQWPLRVFLLALWLVPLACVTCCFYMVHLGRAHDSFTPACFAIVMAGIALYVQWGSASKSGGASSRSRRERAAFLLLRRDRTEGKDD